MSGPYTPAQCEACEQFVDNLCEEHEETCTDCCADLTHEVAEKELG